MEHIENFATLNVGLARNDNTADNDTTGTVIALQRAGLIVHSAHEAESDTETTAVLVVSAPTAAHIIGAAYLACGELAQDCIAIRFDELYRLAGLLVGPNAVKWGEFNPAYFLE